VPFPVNSTLENDTSNKGQLDLSETHPTTCLESNETLAASELYTVKSTDLVYVSPLIGNGEIVTTLGPTGYHNGRGLEAEMANRTLFWAGRRLNTPTHPLVRFGRLTRTLTIDGVTTDDSIWQQRLEYDQACVISELAHGPVHEQTESRVCLTGNVVVFQTRLENRGDVEAAITFALRYALETEVPRALGFPYNTHGGFPLDQDLDDAGNADIHWRVRPIQPSDKTLSALYHIGEGVGEVRIGSAPTAQISDAGSGGNLVRRFALAPGAAVDLWFWVMLSDRRTYTHFPDLERVKALVAEHERAWRMFWNASGVWLDDPELDALYQACLYTIRCNASPWSIPPAYLATHWEGRTFHDELYPFLALLSGNHPDLAVRVPNFRLTTLPVALERGGSHGACFPWEALENGREGGPYGHWMDERFHVGQFSETAWRYYLYMRDTDDLARYYPLLRACAELFVQDVMVRDASGVLKTRLITDFDEQVFPLENGIFTLCAAIRSLENAAQAATILNVDATRRQEWRAMAAELREALPADTEHNYYRISDDSDHWHIGQVGVVFPFAVDPAGERARETLTRLVQMLSTDRNAKPSSVPDNAGTHWMWVVGMLVAALFLQERADEGYALLSRAPASAGPFFAPNEHLCDVPELAPPDSAFTSPDSAAQETTNPIRVPWFTTGAGAVVYAVHTAFVQVDEDGTRLLYGWASSMMNARFERLLASDNVRVSGEIREGELVRLTVHSDHSRMWHASLPARLARRITFTDVVAVSGPDETGALALECSLVAGECSLI
jgi:hypothetical protein